MPRIDSVAATIAEKPILSSLTRPTCAGEVLRQLPVEFAVEAQKLLGISLEGSVG